MSDRIERMTARLRAAREKGPKAMWYIAAMDTLLDIFLERETVTREELKAEMARRREKYADQRVLVLAYDEAIAQLTDPISPGVGD